MIELKSKQLYAISKYTFNESFLESTLNMAGANQARIMEQLKRNSKYLKIQKVAMKVVMTLYLSFLIAIPIQTLLQVKSTYETNIPLDYLLLASSALVSSFFFMQTFYLLMFGMFTSTGLFSPSSYKWLATLPLERRSISKIGLMTLFRSLNLQTIVMTLLLPVAVLILTMNVWVTLVALLISVFNTVFSLVLLVIFGAKFTRVINSNVGNNKLSIIIRGAVILGYFLGTIIASLGIQVVTPIINNLLTDPSITADTALSLNQWLAILPFPFSGGYLLSILYIGTFNTISIPLWPSLIGSVLLAVLDYFLMKKSLSIFYEAIKPETVEKGGKEQISTLEDVRVTIRSPMRSFFKKDAQNITRDIQSMMFILIPIILPSIVFFLTAIPGIGEADDEIYTVFFYLTAFYVFMGAFMLMIGVIDIEKTGASVMASLPVVTREQAKAKIIWALIVIPIANLLPTLMYISKPDFLNIFVSFAINIPMGIIFATFILEMKVFLFGKLKYKYVLDEVKIKGKVLKIILMAVIGLIIYAGYIVATELLKAAYTAGEVYLYLGIGEIILGVIVYWVFNLMFPKVKFPGIHE